MKYLGANKTKDRSRSHNGLWSPRKSITWERCFMFQLGTLPETWARSSNQTVLILMRWEWLSHHRHQQVTETGFGQTLLMHFLIYMESHTISFRVLIIYYVSGFTKPRFKSRLHTFSFRLGQTASNRNNNGTYVLGCERAYIVNTCKVVEQYVALFSLLLKFWRTR